MQDGSSSVALPPPDSHPDVDMDKDQGSQGHLPRDNIPTPPATLADPIGSIQPRFQSLGCQDEKNIRGSSLRAVVATPNSTSLPGPKRVTRSRSRLALLAERPETEDGVVFQSKREQKRRAVPSEPSNVSQDISYLYYYRIKLTTSRSKGVVVETKTRMDIQNVRTIWEALFVQE